jgi:hypothetical protein
MMRTVDARTFEAAFLECAGAVEHAAPRGNAPWTQHMWRVLASTASHLDLHASTTWRTSWKTTLPCPPNIEPKEWLWDWTFYVTRERYARPIIVLEHENAYQPWAFGDDLWTIPCSAASLRVMIGDVTKEQDFGQRFQTVEEVARHFGPTLHGEDLVILGRNGDFRREEIPCGFLAIP